MSVCVWAVVAMVMAAADVNAMCPCQIPSGKGAAAVRILRGRHLPATDGAVRLSHLQPGADVTPRRHQRSILPRPLALKRLSPTRRGTRCVCGTRGQRGAEGTRPRDKALSHCFMVTSRALVRVPLRKAQERRTDGLVLYAVNTSDRSHPVAAADTHDFSQGSTSSC